MGELTSVASLSDSFTYPLSMGAQAPASANQNAVVPVSVAPAPVAIPASLTANGITVTLTSLTGITAIFPIPAGMTYVPSTISVTGGDASVQGNFTATYCTASSAACTAQINTGNYKTTYPYIEAQVNPALSLAGGTNVTLPTVSLDLTASGAGGTVAQLVMTEFMMNANVNLFGGAHTITFDGYPSCGTCANGIGGAAPAYTAPPVLASTTITAASTAPGAPTIGTATANANGSVTVTWTAPASDGGSAITGYTVNVTGPGGPFTGTSAGASATSATVGGLTPGTKYSFTVSATNAIGTGTASGSVSATTAAGTPTPIGTIGGIGLALVIGAGLVVYQRRRLGVRAGA